VERELILKGKKPTTQRRKLYHLNKVYSQNFDGG